MPVNPLATLWIGTCNVYEYQPNVDPITHQTVNDLIPLIEDEPCRLSYNRDTATNIRSGAAVVSQSIILFIAPNLNIPAGCVIDVTQHGRTTRYKGSSKSALYTNHQEIVLDLWEDNA